MVFHYCCDAGNWCVDTCFLTWCTSIYLADLVYGLSTNIIYRCWGYLFSFVNYYHFLFFHYQWFVYFFEICYFFGHTLLYRYLLLIALYNISYFVMIIFILTIITFKTKSKDLTDGINSLLNTLRKLKSPANKLSSMLTISLRFFPTSLEETQKVT